MSNKFINFLMRNSIYGAHPEDKISKAEEKINKDIEDMYTTYSLWYVHSSDICKMNIVNNLNTLIKSHQLNKKEHTITLSFNDRCSDIVFQKCICPDFYTIFKDLNLLICSYNKKNLISVLVASINQLLEVKEVKTENNNEHVIVCSYLVISDITDKVVGSPYGVCLKSLTPKGVNIK